ncbi:MAG: prephenate dehydrogenase [Treponema sp.]|nr:prephenate dehydrogenase [Treponema sp.]
MKPVETCVIGVVGLGLMGGAIAGALRKCGAAGEGKLLACDTDPHVLEAARAGGVIDEGFVTPEALLERADLVYLCLNPSTLLSFMKERMASFKKGALITDIAGVKAAICAAMEETLREDLDFIPGHPMAGSEQGGYANAGRCDFRGKNYILTPLKRNRAENIAFVKSLIHRMGFGKITETSAAAHDRKIAFTSQLCHVIAASLIDCEADTDITSFGGGSFEDLTRIAMLNAPMWTELFLENASPLLSRIDQFEKSLGELRALIAGGRAGALEQRLEAVREKRALMSG